ncbi:MAG: O-antigen ligase family protein [Nitrospinota bacterium]
MPRERDGLGSDPDGLGPRPIFEPKAERLLRNSTELGLHLLIVLSPVFFGATPDWAYLPARALVLLLTGLTVLRLCTNRAVRPVWTWLSPPAVLFLGYVLFSLVPLPGFVLEALSPGAFAHSQEVARWRAEVDKSLLAPLQELVVGGAQGTEVAAVPSTLSVDPWRTRQALLSLLTPLLVFFVAANLGGSRRQTKRFLVTVAGTAGVISAYGLFQVFTGRPYVLWSMVPHGGRVLGAFINPNHFALYLEIALPLTLVLVGSFFLADGPEEDTGWRSALSRFRRGWGPGFVFVTLSLALSFLALLYTQSRMGLASFLLVSIAGTPFLVRKRRTLALRSVALLFLGSFLVAKVWVGIDQPLRRLVTLTYGVERGRLQVWVDSRDFRRDFFLTGSGLGSFEVMYPKYQTIQTHLKFDHAHNDFLEVWTETGVIGFGLVLLGIGAVGWEMIRLRSRRQEPFVLLFSGAAMIGIGSVLLHSLGDFGLRIPANAYLFALTGGLTVAALNRSRRGPRDAARREGSSRKWPCPVAAVLVGALLAGIALDTALGFGASLRFRSAERGGLGRGLGIGERRALLRGVASLRPREEGYLLALVSAEELRMRLDLMREPEDGLRSALRALELVGRAQILHPASGNFVFGEGLILSHLDRWMSRQRGRGRSLFRLPAAPAAERRERQVQMLGKLRPQVARLAWEAFLRAVSWEPTRLAFHYALGLYGAFRWEGLGVAARQQTRASIAEAAGLAACGDRRRLQVLRMMARRLNDKELEEKVRRARCVPFRPAPWTEASVRREAGRR